MGFASAAKWLAEGFSARSKVQVKLEVQPNLPRLHEDIELALFRILQEGLTNVHKHSESASVEITVKASASAVSIRMRDFGKGIPANIIESFKKSRPGLGVGLAGMRERIRDLGGHLELESDGRGAVIEASIPFASAAVRRGAVRTAPANARDSSPELS
jgi:signal transduction histidine kinase